MIFSTSRYFKFVFLGFRKTTSQERYCLEALPSDELTWLNSSPPPPLDSETTSVEWARLGFHFHLRLNLSPRVGLAGERQEVKRVRICTLETSPSPWRIRSLLYLCDIMFILIVDPKMSFLPWCTLGKVRIGDSPSQVFCINKSLLRAVWELGVTYIRRWFPVCIEVFRWFPEQLLCLYAVEWGGEGR